MNVWRAYMLFIWAFFCFQASTALCIFMSTHANSWIKVAARQNIIWIRFGNRRAVRRRRAEAGMALTAIGEFAQWGGVADCSGSRTPTVSYPLCAQQSIIKQRPLLIKQYKKTCLPSLGSSFFGCCMNLHQAQLRQTAQAGTQLERDWIAR